jgi:hypothetical protein
MAGRYYASHGERPPVPNCGVRAAIGPVKPLPDTQWSTALMRRFAGLHLAIGQGYGDGHDTDLGDTFFGVDADFLPRSPERDRRFDL